MTIGFWIAAIVIGIIGLCFSIAVGALDGNWGGMLLTGIRELYPAVWDAIPDDMGISPFACICSVLILCGVDTSE